MEENKTTTERNGILNRKNTLYCNHCNQPISIESESCPHCGNADPFLFKKILKTKKDTEFRWWWCVVAAFGVELYYAKEMGISDGIINWHTFQIKTFACVCIAIYAIMQIARYSYISDYRSEMHKVFDKVNDKNADERWYEKAKVKMWDFLDND